MKISSILIMALATGALGAQEAPNLDGRIQMFAEVSRPTQITLAGDLKDQPKRTTGFGVRFLGEVASAPGWYYEVGGMFDADSHFTFNGNTSATNTLDMTDVKVTDSYWSLGAAYMGKVADSFTWGVHLEARGEYLRIQGEAIVNGGVQAQDQATTYLRPWLRGSFDYTFMNVGATKHPYIGVEGSVAILKTSQTQAPDLASWDNRNLKALAPRASAAIYAGLRF